jgi:hypothetical protein
MKCRMMVVILVGLICASAFAQDHLGLGVILGEPTGFSIKYWIDKEQAVDGGVGWSFWDEDGFQLHADYLWHNFEWLQPAVTAGKLPVYFGAGARLKFRDNNNWRDDDGDTVFGLRAPAGISYLFDDKPIEVFAEIAPILDLAPDVELNLSLAVGMRFYVK